MRYMSDNRILVMIPTYNERENAVGLYEHLKKIDLDLDILFIDDGSPDGTGVALSDLSKKDQNRIGPQGWNSLGLRVRVQVISHYGR